MVSIPRALLITALLGVILACIGAFGAQGQTTRDAVLRSMASRSLDELALLSGVVDDEGQLQRDAKMELEVVSDGGPMWALESVEAAVMASSHFTLGNSTHLLRSEMLDEHGGIAVQLHLWRAGWELREPEPSRARIAPWTAVLAGVLGALVALLTSRMSYGFVTAGVVGQLALSLDPLPEHLFPPQRLAEAWASGPLVREGLDWIQTMSTLHMGLVLALLSASLVLVAFDHRRSRGEDEDLSLGGASLTAVLGTLGALTWIEAASRGSLFAACDVRVGAYFGYLVLLGLILAWLPAIRVSRDSWRT